MRNIFITKPAQYIIGKDFIIPPIFEYVVDENNGCFYKRAVYTGFSTKTEFTIPNNFIDLENLSGMIVIEDYKFHIHSKIQELLEAFESKTKRDPHYKTVVKELYFHILLEKLDFLNYSMRKIEQIAIEILI